MLEQIKKHIDELQTEKELYKDYEENETEATCIEYCVYHKHLQEIQTNLDKFASQYSAIVEKYTALKNDEIDQFKRKNALKDKIESLTFEDQNLRNKENLYLDDLRELQQRIEKIKIQRANLETSKLASSQFSSIQDIPEKVEEFEDLARKANQELHLKEGELNIAKGNTLIKINKYFY